MPASSIPPVSSVPLRPLQTSGSAESLANSNSNSSESLAPRSPISQGNEPSSFANSRNRSSGEFSQSENPAPAAGVGAGQPATAQYLLRKLIVHDSNNKGEAKEAALNKSALKLPNAILTAKVEIEIEKKKFFNTFKVMGNAKFDSNLPFDPNDKEAKNKNYANAVSDMEPDIYRQIHQYLDELPNPPTPEERKNISVKCELHPLAVNLEPSIQPVTILNVVNDEGIKSRHYAGLLTRTPSDHDLATREALNAEATKSVENTEILAAPKN